MASKIVLTPAQRAFVRKHTLDFSEEGWDISLAGQAASRRSFIRIADKKNADRSFILVVWNSHDEDWPRFLAIPSDIAPYAPFLPKIYHADARHGLVLEEDLGDRTLHRVVRHADGDEAAIMAAYRRVIDALCAWQSIDTKASAVVASRAMDLETFLWESDYFARRGAVDFCGCGEGMIDGAWETERRALALAAASLPKTFIHRDFQSENIMFCGDKVRFVDFQGARLGPPTYDVASLLYDPYVNCRSVERIALLFDYYCSRELPVHSSSHDFDLCAAQRLMQACGAYGNLSVHQGKPRYREFIPVALDRLNNVMERLPEYPTIKKVVECCREAVGKNGIIASASSLHGT